MMAGRDYALVALSIDPSEIHADAAVAKAEDLQRYPAPGAAQNWHFLIGTFNAVQAAANAVGFHERFDPDLKQFAHPVGTGRYTLAIMKLLRAITGVTMAGVLFLAFR
jgi:protein SCO1/2